MDDSCFLNNYQIFENRQKNYVVLYFFHDLFSFSQFCLKNYFLKLDRMLLSNILFYCYFSFNVLLKEVLEKIECNALYFFYKKLVFKKLPRFSCKKN